MKTIDLHTSICIGKDALDILKKIQNARILIIADAFLVKNHLVRKITEKLAPSNKIVIFDRVKPDPPLATVSEAIRELIRLDATHIIGFGGGSAIDTAKGVVYFLKESGQYTCNPEFIAIATTSGTGSEVTAFTVISDEENKVKRVLISDQMLPNIAILDASLTKTLPKTVVSHTGMDVFTHALESYVSKGASDYSDALSQKAGELIVKYLYRSYANAEDAEAREKMYIASNLAGLAFNLAGLGINHSIAHQIGGMFHVPHGLANALLLCAAIDCNCRDKKTMAKYAEFAKKTGLVEMHKQDEFAVSVLKEFVRSMMRLMDMQSKLRDCAVDETEFRKNVSLMAKNAIQDRCFSSNPVGVDRHKIVEILHSLY